MENTVLIDTGTRLKDLEETVEQNRQKAIEEVTQLNECVDKALDTVELLELGLKHTAVVYSVNKLINIKITLGYILRALKDTEE